MAQRGNYSVEFDLCERGDDHAYATVNLKLTCDVTLPTPESGRSGPPELYDPGDGGEVFLVGVSAEGQAAGVLGIQLDWRPLAHAWLERNEDLLFDEARNQANAERERAMEDAR